MQDSLSPDHETHIRSTELAVAASMSCSAMHLRPQGGLKTKLCTQSGELSTRTFLRALSPRLTAGILVHEVAARSQLKAAVSDVTWRTSRRGLRCLSADASSTASLHEKDVHTTMPSRCWKQGGHALSRRRSASPHLQHAGACVPVGTEGVQTWPTRTVTLRSTAASTLHRRASGKDYEALGIQADMVYQDSACSVTRIADGVSDQIAVPDRPRASMRLMPIAQVRSSVSQIVAASGVVSNQEAYESNSESISLASLCLKPMTHPGATDAASESATVGTTSPLTRRLADVSTINDTMGSLTSHGGIPCPGLCLAQLQSYGLNSVSVQIQTDDTSGPKPLGGHAEAISAKSQFVEAGIPTEHCPSTHADESQSCIGVASLGESEAGRIALSLRDVSDQVAMKRKRLLAPVKDADHHMNHDVTAVELDVTVMKRHLSQLLQLSTNCKPVSACQHYMLAQGFIKCSSRSVVLSALRGEYHSWCALAESLCSRLATRYMIRHNQE
jgi:hypothetical protein